MYKDICRVFINLPIIGYILLNIFLGSFIGLSLIWSRVLIQGILLLSIGICLSLDNKKVNLTGIILIIVNIVYYIITGYYDSLFSDKFDVLKLNIYVSCFITIYYLLMYFLKSIPFKKKEQKNSTIELV